MPLALQIMGSIVAIAVALVIFPVSGVGSSTAAATEALAEMEQAAMALRDGVLSHIADRRAYGDKAVSKAVDSNNQQQPEGEKPSAEAPDSVALLPCWAVAREALCRAEADSTRMAVQLASVTAYPVSLYLGKGSQGNDMLLQLCRSAPALAKALQVCALGQSRRVCWGAKVH